MDLATAEGSDAAENQECPPQNSSSTTSPQPSMEQKTEEESCDSSLDQTLELHLGCDDAVASENDKDNLTISLNHSGADDAYEPYRKESKSGNSSILKSCLDLFYAGEEDDLPSLFKEPTKSTGHPEHRPSSALLEASFSSTPLQTAEVKHKYPPVQQLLHIRKSKPQCFVVD